MASQNQAKPAVKPAEHPGKKPAVPPSTGRPRAGNRPERPIADVDRKVRGGDA
ncbi:hypothetical protein [Hydrogenophaga sp.]|uniref:hypothetical protein n=1 Tax=Hydrogenophaga sp. TaxID=1904254 RepID=UPI003F70FE21